MLSLGIRFGEGFDRYNVLKLMQTIPTERDYNFLVIGSSPGGIACAREASLAGKKTAIIKYRKNSAAEAEGYDEDLQEIAQLLVDKTFTNQEEEDSTGNVSSIKLENKNVSSTNALISESKSILSSSKPSESRKSVKKGSWSRKIRESRLDLNNELYKRGKEGRKLMLKAATIQNSIKQAITFGWRIYTSLNTLTINWKKLSELVMDRIMKENWSLINALANEGIEILEGIPSFVDKHTVRIQPADSKVLEVTADIICAAPSAEYILPSDVQGASEYGITCEDFIRLTEPPGKTLVVGGTPEGLECAAIVACLGIPVVVASRSELLKRHDKQMTHMIVESLKNYGVVFRERTSLTSIKLTKKNKLSAELESVEVPPEGNQSKIKEEEFDTIVFAVGRQINLDHLNLDAVEIELDDLEHKICTDNQNLASAPNIYVVGDAVAFQPHSPEISKTTGRLLGQRLFWNKNEVMDYSMIPYIINTPIEYAFVGVSEDGAIYRFGKDCIEIIEEMFSPLDLIGLPQEYQCHLKAIVYKPKNLIIGLHMFGPEAGEVIQGFAAAIKLGMTVTTLQTLVGIPATKGHELTQMSERKSTSV